VDFQDPQLIKTEVERRRYRRVKIVAQVHCEALERKEVMVTRDVSIGGMFLNAEFPLPLDSDLVLTFRLSPTDPPITCSAKVMFSRVGMGMGIQFVDLSPEARDLIERFIEEAG
jgi:c-di-GMP-binding flagellar brake protein YcgR